MSITGCIIEPLSPLSLSPHTPPVQLLICCWALCWPGMFLGVLSKLSRHVSAPAGRWARAPGSFGSLIIPLHPVGLDWTAAMNTSKVEFEPFEYSYYDYSDWYSNNAEPTQPPKEWVSNLKIKKSRTDGVKGLFGDFVLKKVKCLVIGTFSVMQSYTFKDIDYMYIYPSIAIALRNKLWHYFGSSNIWT